MSNQQSTGDQYKKETASSTDYKDVEFNYWLLLFLTIFLIPCYIWLYKKYKSKASIGSDCKCSGCLTKLQEKEKLHRAEKKSLPNKIKIGLLIVTTLLYLYLIYSVSTTSLTIKEPYNPYKILELTEGASPEEIKKSYRKLSLKYHPDKNQSPEAPEIFMAISKAYEALTDESVREKYEKYGNPDGPQPISVGIALPSWLINKSNSSWVLASYLLLLVIALPSGVYYWVKSQKNVTISQQTLGLYFHLTDATLRLKSLIEIIAASEEYKTLPERTTDENDLKTIVKNIPSDYKVKKNRLNAKYIVKGTHLMYAHISRIHHHLSEPLKEDLKFMLSKYRFLLNAAFQMCKDKREPTLMVELLKLSQCMSQAAWDDQPLKQLPHFDSYLIDIFQRRYRIRDLLKLKQIGKDKRQEYLESAELSKESINDIEYVLNKIPSQVGVHYKLVPTDPSGVIHHSAVCGLEIEFYDKLVTKSFKVQKSPTTEVTSPSSKKNIDSSKSTVTKRSTATKDKKNSNDNNNNNSKKDEDLNSDDSDKDSKDNEDSDFSDEEFDSDSDSDSDWEPVKKPKFPDTNKEICHSPFVTEERPANWWIILSDTQKGELVGFATSKTAEAGTVVKLPFLTAENPGTRNYNLYVMCDSYIGCDFDQSINIKLMPNNPNPIPPMRPPQRPVPPIVARKEEKEKRRAEKKLKGLKQQPTIAQQ